MDLLYLNIIPRFFYDQNYLPRIIEIPRVLVREFGEENLPLHSYYLGAFCRGAFKCEGCEF